jgi:hypothetical protein
MNARLTTSLLLLGLSLGASAPTRAMLPYKPDAETQIRPGQSQSEVEALIGRPDGGVRRIDYTKHVIWRYQTRVPETFLMVEFNESGHVVSAARQWVNPY